MIGEHEEELWLPMPPDEDEEYFRAIKTAMLLTDWTDELPDVRICERYAVGPGDVYGMVESVNWLLHATTELSRMFAPAFHIQIREYEICMKNGIRRELLPLVRLRVSDGSGHAGFSTITLPPRMLYLQRESKQ